MKKSLTILDPDYLQWVQDIVMLYRRSQIKAAIKVNTEQLSKDLKKEMPGVEGLSVTNLRYCRRFYLLYSNVVAFRPQVEGGISFR